MNNVEQDAHVGMRKAAEKQVTTSIKAKRVRKPAKKKLASLTTKVDGTLYSRMRIYALMNHMTNQQVIEYWIKLNCPPL